jgi:hypothetical protein
MTSWIKVVTHPLGLTGFALFLVFSFLGRNRQREKPNWLTPSAFAMALIALIGGLSLAYQQNTRPTATSSGQQIGKIQQNSSGSSTLNAAGVQGNVSQSITAPTISDHPPSGPLAEENIMSMLAAGTKSDKIVAEIESRGVAFRMSPNLRNKFRAAGATKAVLDELERNHKQ